MEKVTQNIVNIGVNDREITLFEGQYALEKGMAYKSGLFDYSAYGARPRWQYFTDNGAIS